MHRGGGWGEQALMKDRCILLIACQTEYFLNNKNIINLVIFRQTATIIVYEV